MAKPFNVDKFTLELRPNNVDVTNEIKMNFNLFQNYPNPFNPITTIKYTIPFVERLGKSFYNVQLKVYDILGKEVATIVNGEKAAGNYQVNFDANDLTSGIYYYQMVVGDLSTSSRQRFIESKKMVLLK